MPLTVAVPGGSEVSPAAAPAVAGAVERWHTSVPTPLVSLRDTAEGVLRDIRRVVDTLLHVVEEIPTLEGPPLGVWSSTTPDPPPDTGGSTFV